MVCIVVSIDVVVVISSDGAVVVGSLVVIFVVNIGCVGAMFDEGRVAVAVDALVIVVVNIFEVTVVLMYVVVGASVVVCG